MPTKPLEPAQLYRTSDLSGIPFATTEDLPEFRGVLGQERAVEAISFGARIDQKGYNLFVFGRPGTGRHGTISEMLRQKAAGEPPPEDWVYVNNFATPHKPRALRLPAHRGHVFREAMHRLTEDIRTAIPAVFESEDYGNRRRAIEQTFVERQGAAFESLRKHGDEKGIALIRTPMGFGLAPMENGEVIKPEAFDGLPKDQQARIKADIEQLQKELEDIVGQVPRWDKERRDAVRELNREITAFTVGHPIDELKQAFADLPDIVEHLEAVRADLVENVHMLLGVEQTAIQGMAGPGGGSGGAPAPAAAVNALQRYEVNLLVADGERDSAPVVFEDNPTLGNLIGRIEHSARFGALVTDFTLLKGGALHAANGGYLIMDAQKLLTQPFAWDALKRALRSSRITIESADQIYGLISTVSLQPEPIPLKVKVVLYGERQVFYLLGGLDPEFNELFKVEVDFDDQMDRTTSSEALYTQLIASVARREGLRPFDRGAVERLIEHASRLADDNEKVSIRVSVLADLMREAAWLAHEENAPHVGRQHVQSALDAQIRRADRLRQRSHEAIVRNIVLIDTDSARVGQVNGLSVLQLGNFSFGQPSRISARVYMGTGKVVDIEREVALGGPLHSKGVLILSGFLASRFAVNRPLALAASLVFEQSYGGVEGDSASSAELYALLSAISEVPLSQSLAVTGSVNQFGEVQAIGGVNEKIEGFFDICRARGLTGRQGVLIPASNVRHLMLRQDVVGAVREGKFRIYPVSTIDEGIELLSGRPAGERGADGRFPEGSVNRAVENRLASLAEARRRYIKEMAPAEEGKGG